MVTLKYTKLKRAIVISLVVVLACSVVLNITQYRHELFYRKLPAEIANEMGAWLYRQMESCDTDQLVADYSWTRYSRPTGEYIDEDHYFVDPNPIELETVTILLKKQSQITDICKLAGRLAEGFRQESSHRIQPKYFSLVSIQDLPDGKSVWLEYLIPVYNDYRIENEIQKVTKILESSTSGYLFVAAESQETAS